MNDVPPEIPAEIRRLLENRNRRPANPKIFVALYLVAMSLLTAALYGGFNNPTLRPSILLLWIVAGIGFLMRYQRAASRARTTFSPSDRLPAALGEGAQKVFDLKDLPPEMASDPEMQKLFEWAHERGASVKISRRVISPGAENAAKVKIGLGFGASGPFKAGSVEEGVQPSAEPPSGADIEKLAKYVQTHGVMPADLGAVQGSGSPASPGTVPSLSRSVTLVLFVSIAAALGAAAVALWMVTNGPRAH
jgi:hypothetical protein